MKTLPICRFLTTLLTVALLWSDAQASSIGLNFRRDTGPTELVLGVDIAGLDAQDAWNNTSGAAGANTGTTANILNPVVGSLVDSDANILSTTVSWWANGTWSANNTTDPDAKLMSGYLDTTSARTMGRVVFNDVPYAHYDVIAYLGSDGNDRLGRVDIVGSKHDYSYFRTFSATFPNAGSYLTNPNKNATEVVDGARANYIRFTGMSGSSFALYNSRINNNVGLHGVQIIEMPGDPPAPNPDPPPPALELLGYWPFEGNANDGSGNGNHAALNGNAAFAAGKFGDAMSLDGTGDFAVITNPTAVLKPTDSVAISAWVRRTSVGTNDEVLSLGDHYLLRIRNDNRFQLSVDINPTGNNWMDFTSANNASEQILNDGLWHHIVVQKGSPALEMYLDGVKVASNTVNDQMIVPINYAGIQPTPPGAPGYFFIGAHGGSPADLATRNTGFDFGGLIDEVRVFRGALTQDQVTNLFQNNVVPEPATWTLLAVGLFGAGVVRTVRRRSA